ncbi:hypothetical protein [Actinocrispum sp. NPDC049592]|uniref:hypothetical protein n=1 Tax=Actinocrispum sp. NPDC049592 TaxID=3154835 RepID=UPI003444C0DE
MRNTIRRGMFLTATAGFALLGFGLGQASAAVPALPPLQATPNVPSLPQLPTPGLDTPSLGSLPTLPDTGLLGGITDTTASRSGLPATPKLPTAKDLPLLGGIADLPSLMDLVPQNDGLTGMADLPSLGEDSLPTADLPSNELGLPATETGDLPVGLDPQQLPQLPQLPAESSELTKAPVVQLPNTQRLPVVAQVDHNDITHKIVPNTDGVDVQGLPKPQVPDVADTPNAVKLPNATPKTPGMESLGLPTTLPVVSDIDTTMPSLDDLTGGTQLPTELPELPAV